jgi:four helix bundle protein
MARNYKKIKAWERADDLVWEIFNLLRNIPENEDDRELRGEIKKIAIKIPVSIAKGSVKRNNNEFLSYLNESIACINELDYLIHLSKRLGYLKEEDYKKLINSIEQTSKLIYGFKNYLEKQISKN